MGISKSSWTAYQVDERNTKDHSTVVFLFCQNQLSLLQQNDWITLLRKRELVARYSVFLSSKHTTLKQRRIDVDGTSHRRRYDVDKTVFRRNVIAGCCRVGIFYVSLPRDAICWSVVMAFPCVFGTVLTCLFSVHIASRVDLHQLPRLPALRIILGPLLSRPTSKTPYNWCFTKLADSDPRYMMAEM